jgi:hypothetical protein
MNNNGRNRKLLWAAGAVLVFLYFAPSALQSFRQATFYRQQAEARASAQAGRGTAQAAAPSASPTNVSANAPATAATIPMSNFTGMWQGQQAQPNRDLCQMALEMRDNAGGLSAYPRINCVALMPYLPGPHKLNPEQATAKSMSTVSAVLTGTRKDGAVAFHVDKAIGATFDGCALTSFTVTPFGNDEVAAEWQNGTCERGQIMLRRVGK